MHRRVNVSFDVNIYTLVDCRIELTVRVRVPPSGARGLLFLFPIMSTQFQRSDNNILSTDLAYQHMVLHYR